MSPRLIAMAIVAALVCGAGFWSGYAWRGSDVRDAERARDKAETELREYRAEVKQAGADQAIQAAKVSIEQNRTTQESTHAYIDHRGSLEQRIAAGGLRLRTDQGSASGCSLGPVAKTAAGAAEPAAQSVPADPAGGATALPGRVEPPLPSSRLKEDAARDALQLAHLIDTACRLGLCAGETTEQGSLHGNPDQDPD